MARMPRSVPVLLVAAAAIAVPATLATGATSSPPFVGKYVGTVPSGQARPKELKLKVVKTDTGLEVFSKLVVDFCWGGDNIFPDRIGPILDGRFEGLISFTTTSGSSKAAFSGEFFSRKRATVQVDSTSTPIGATSPACTESTTFTVTRVKPPKKKKKK